MSGTQSWDASGRQDLETPVEYQGELSVNTTMLYNAGVNSTRTYLNGLVKETENATEFQLCNVAFLKTHKTASTTVAAILYRYARRHHVKLAHFSGGTEIDIEVAAAQTVRRHDPVDIMHYHISHRGHFKGTLADTLNNYKRIMRDPMTINFITVLREPRSHLLSYYYYFLEPNLKLSIEDFLLNAGNSNNENHRLLINPLSAEFGVRNDKQMKHLVDYVLPTFKLIILTERLEESVLLLRHLLHWQLIDVTYITLNRTRKGQKRWDGMQFIDRPHFDDLPPEVQQKIDELIALDHVLYNAGKREFNKRLSEVSTVMNDDMVKFQQLQSVMCNYLDGNSSSLANKMYKTMEFYDKPPPLYDF